MMIKVVVTTATAIIIIIIIIIPDMDREMQPLEQRKTYKYL
jgi:hypothetical protein